jgi:argininosuccinate lyase
MQVLREAFTQALDPKVSKLLTSVEVDEHLVQVDITGSIAHATMLAEKGLLTDEQAASIQAGLEELKGKFASGQLHLQEQFEDVHMNVEKQLEAVIGQDALRLHTARSRNDQVALDFRLYVSEQITAIIALVRELQAALLKKAAGHAQVVMPGYTHLQRAQPIMFAHAILACYEMLERDAERFEQAQGRTKVSPLGAGAQAGTALNIDPETTASILGLSKVFRNSIDAVMDRDFAADFLMAASLCHVHLSQLCETLIIWNTAEFAFIKLADSVTTSSSLMPQKKNPDPLEIVRGKSGLATGEMVNLLVTLKGLPLGYNRDLQETKLPAIRAAQSLKLCLEAMAVCIEAVEVQPQRMYDAASDPDLMATDLVEYLVLKGVPFRTAHKIVAETVQHARLSGCSLADVPLSWLSEKCSKFQADVFELFDPLKSAQSKSSSGGTGHADTVAALLRSPCSKI